MVRSTTAKNDGIEEERLTKKHDCRGGERKKKSRGVGNEDAER